MGDTELKLEGAVKQFIFGLGCPKKIRWGSTNKNHRNGPKVSRTSGSGFFELSQTYRQTHVHCDSMTESAQWADSVKRSKVKRKNPG